jgi:ABC-type proline/glycine betaine transport system substrate-binding protein
MKLIKALTFIVGAIALFPSASFAGNLSANEQSVDLSSTTIGSGNVSSTTTRQSIFNNQKAGRHGENVSGTRQAITGHTETLGDYNINVKDIYQKYGNVQKAK